MTKVPLLLLLLLLLHSLSLSSGEIKKLKITEDSRAMILFERFGFTHTGHATISVSSVSVVSTLATPDPARLGFFLLSEQSLIQILIELQQNPSSCVLQSKFIKSLFDFRSLSPPPSSSFNYSFPVNSPDEYSLFFANCEPESKVSMDVRTELYNVDEGGSKDYLSAGLTQLPTLYSLFSVQFLDYLCIRCFLHSLYGGVGGGGGGREMGDGRGTGKGDY